MYYVYNVNKSTYRVAQKNLDTLQLHMVFAGSGAPSTVLSGYQVFSHL